MDGDQSAQSADFFFHFPVIRMGSRGTFVLRVLHCKFQMYKDRCCYIAVERRRASGSAEYCAWSPSDCASSLPDCTSSLSDCALSLL